MFFTLLAAYPLAAQETTNQFWPEIDLFANLSSKPRASWISTHATDKDSNTATWEFGPNLDIYLKSIRNRHSQTLDAAKRKYLVMRLGYRVLPSPNGNTEHDASLNTKTNNATRELIHHDENPMCPQGCGFTSEQIAAPQTVLRRAGWVLAIL
jgi:hypothetical protein